MPHQVPMVHASGHGSAAKVGFRIHEAAEAIGVSASTLRLWEAQGLLVPRRNESGYRIYADADMAVLRRIKRLRDVEKLNAAGIRRVLVGATNHERRTQRVDGEALRRLRREHGMSLKEAAAAVSMSTSYISAVERGIVNPSVSALQRLTHAYGVKLLDLFNASGTGRRVKAEERPALEMGGTRIEQLAPAGGSLMEPQLFVLSGGSSSEGAYTHEGEEFLFVLSGSLRIWIGDTENYDLYAGDSLYFPSHLAHRWQNLASSETQLLWVNTPATF